jgi:integrase/recombinase XerD
MRSKYIDKKIVALLRTELGSEKWLPLRISLETGLRIGDCVDLLYGQIHRKKNGSAYISTTAQKTGKNGDFPISDALYKIIIKKRKKEGTGKADFIFPSYGESGHLTRQAAWYRMKTAAAALGIVGDGLSPHSLRKCFAVNLMREHGLDAVRKALQHSNDAVTRIYAYADTILNYDSDAPIRWRDVELIVDYVLQRLHEKT